MVHSRIQFCFRGLIGKAAKLLTSLEKCYGVSKPSASLMTGCQPRCLKYRKRGRLWSATSNRQVSPFATICYSWQVIQGSGELHIDLLQEYLNVLEDFEKQFGMLSEVQIRTQLKIRQVTGLRDGVSTTQDQYLGLKWLIHEIDLRSHQCWGQPHNYQTRKQHQNPHIHHNRIPASWICLGLILNKSCNFYG